MSDKPAVSSKRLIRVLKRNGYVIRSQKGFHVFMYLPDSRRKCGCIPRKTTLKMGTLMEIKRQFGFTDKEFNNILDQC